MSNVYRYGAHQDLTLARDVFFIGYNTVLKYNGFVNPEDQVL